MEIIFQITELLQQIIIWTAISHQGHTPYKSLATLNDISLVNKHLNGIVRFEILPFQMRHRIGKLLTLQNLDSISLSTDEHLLVSHDQWTESCIKDYDEKVRRLVIHGHVNILSKVSDIETIAWLATHQLGTIINQPEIYPHCREHFKNLVARKLIKEWLQSDPSTSIKFTEAFRARPFLEAARNYLTLRNYNETIDFCNFEGLFPALIRFLDSLVKNGSAEIIPVTLIVKVFVANGTEVGGILGSLFASLLHSSMRQNDPQVLREFFEALAQIKFKNCALNLLQLHLIEPTLNSFLFTVGKIGLFALQVKEDVLDSVSIISTDIDRVQAEEFNQICLSYSILV